MVTKAKSVEETPNENDINLLNEEESTMADTETKK